MVKKNEVAAPQTDVATKVKEKNITDVVFNKVDTMMVSGSLFLPPTYSAANALKSAWLTLQEVKDRDGHLALNHCTKESIANALLDMVVQGLSPAKKQCYFIPYGKQLTLIRSYMGTVAVAKRVGGVSDVIAHCIYQEDDFEYQIVPETGLIKIIKHQQSFANIDIDKITGAYAVVMRPGEDNYIELMTMDQIKKAWGQGATKGGSPAHKNFTDEMAKKTVINRACKMFVNTGDDSDLLVEAFNRTGEAEFPGFHRSPDIIEIDASEADDLAAAKGLILPDAADVPANNEELSDPTPEEGTPFDLDAPDSLVAGGGGDA